jgi:hypothetical protein
MILTPEILTIYILEFLFAVFATIAFFISINIVLNWDSNKSTKKQYSLEKQTYLNSTIIKFILYIKIPLFVFFIFTIDDLSKILPGAMCGAGVINATDYGVILLLLKILNIYLFMYWIVLDRYDQQQELRPYTKLKFLMFIFIYILFLIEIVYEINMFSAIDIKSVVDCCGVIFSTTDNSYISKVFELPFYIIVGMFYTTYMLLVLFAKLRYKYMFSIINLLFLIISLISLISFFGTYIYELPTHHCPFCMLQSDYNYIGYVLYISLFIGTFYGGAIGFINYKISVIANTIYMLIVSFYPIYFYIKNGVWL